MPLRLSLITAAVLGCVLTLSAHGAPRDKKAGTTPQTLLQAPADIFLEGCKTELDTYCKNVTPGENRLLACIYSHQDKLSGRCEFALYDAAEKLEHAVAALSYAAAECEDDLERFCSGIAAGEGRLLACLEKNEKQVSAQCKQALKDMNLQK